MEIATIVSPYPQKTKCKYLRARRRRYTYYDKCVFVRVLLFNFFDISIQTVAGSDHTARDTTKLDSVEGVNRASL